MRPPEGDPLKLILRRCTGGQGDDDDTAWEDIIPVAAPVEGRSPAASDGAAREDSSWESLEVRMLAADLALTFLCARLEACVCLSKLQVVCCTLEAVTVALCLRGAALLACLLAYLCMSGRGGGMTLCPQAKLYALAAGVRYQELSHPAVWDRCGALDDALALLQVPP